MNYEKESYKNKMENIEEVNLNKDFELLTLLDSLQEQIKYYKNLDLKVSKLEDELYQKQHIKESQEDLFIQIDHFQKILDINSKKYQKLYDEYQNIIGEMEEILSSLNKYKKLCKEQNKEILRAIEILKN